MQFSLGYSPWYLVNALETCIAHQYHFQGVSSTQSNLTWYNAGQS
jgi:hypothetical protein